MRLHRHVWLGLLVAPLAPALVVACGLEDGGVVTVVSDPDGAPTFESGSDAFNSKDGGDAARSDTSVPPVCTTIDASCVPSVPTGWNLFGIAAGTKNCPSADFDPFPFVANARLNGASCSCAACGVSGNYVCGGITLKTGTACNSTTDTSVSSPVCISRAQKNGSAKVAGFPAAASGTPTCSIMSTGNNSVDTDPVSGCRPNKCTADYCGLKGAGFQRCVEHDGLSACPAGFTFLAFVGTSASATCNACGCNVDPAKPCTGNIRIFDNNSSCDGNGSTAGPDYVKTVVADGTCQDPSSNFDSLYYVPDPAAAATCAPAAPSPGTGTANLVGGKTICCAP